MNASPQTPDAVTLNPSQQAVYDALLILRRNGQSDATAIELREVIERLGLYMRGDKPVLRIEKGWVNGRLSELADLRLAVKLHGQDRMSELTGRWSAPWCLSATAVPVSAPGGPGNGEPVVQEVKHA